MARKPTAANRNRRNPFDVESQFGTRTPRGAHLCLYAFLAGRREISLLRKIGIGRNREIARRASSDPAELYFYGCYGFKYGPEETHSPRWVNRGYVCAFEALEELRGAP